MSARGPKSSAALATVTPLTKQPPKADASLTEAQVVIWDRLARSKPAEHFTNDDLPMLAELCRAFDACNQLALRIDRTIAKASSQTLRDIMGLRDKESRRAMSLATKLRLTAQSRYDKNRAATISKQATRGAPPWSTAHGSGDPADRFFKQPGDE